MTSTASRSESDEDRWFFGKISGQEAEDHLKNAGGQDGTFLVRESSSSPGHFALTFMFHGEKTDVLIRSYWEDAFYSLITDTSRIFHGLDTLIFHYCQQPLPGGGPVLSIPCLGEAPPPESRLHGSSNLLHRAVSQENIKVVSELLKSGYRKIDAKNNCGQTALHIACTKGNLELVRLLLEANANVDVRDQDGMTPLQHACRHNYPSIVHLLITEGKANLQLRIPVTGEVALHEAASCGSLECVKLLLSFHAPAWPRCSKKNTPAMLAKANQNLECYSLIVNHRPTIPLVRLPEYYHGRLTRDEAQRILKDQEGDGGQFLLRKSSSNESVFVLSMKEMGQVYHFQIDRKFLAMYTIDNGPYFKCLETLVDHYLRFFDGLPCRLTTPVPPLEPLDESEFRAIYFEDEKFARSGSELELLVPSDDTEDDSYKDNFCLFSFDGFAWHRGEITA
ncbi:Tyrosine-protein kinase shark [Armadillidium vulgare]|nr:Tyrosine-protein kinase shark [Armadillidium vulgare]